MAARQNFKVLMLT